MSRLIDAEKVKEILKHLLYETAMNNSGGASLMCEDIAENRLETWLGLVPTVDAEPVKRGRWEFAFMLYGSVKISKCSVCEHLDDLESNYCPNCGAKMDEVTNENISSEL